MTIKNYAIIRRGNCRCISACDSLPPASGANRMCDKFVLEKIKKLILYYELQQLYNQIARGGAEGC